MTSVIDTTGRPTISLESANRFAELQTRVDRKYIIDRTVLAHLQADLPSGYHQLCIDGSTEFGYTSIYFDTPELLTYRAAAHRRRRRFKVRTRTYEESGSCMLEVKTKGRRGATIKTRSPHRLHDASRLTSGGCQFVDDVTGSVGTAQNMEPVLSVHYRRRTLVDVDSHSRLTVDRSLRCVDSEGRTAALDGIVVETKSNGKPSPADRWLWSHGVRPLKVSKFGIGLALTHPELPSNRWHRAMRRNWSVS